MEKLKLFLIKKNILESKFNHFLLFFGILNHIINWKR
ncbi:hypothetical protein PRO82_000239 [Candidatus Protochlamydia amoebophila]|nr:hypothetical protein [Candidatus Protochlamydia amoebophila]